MHEGNKWWKLVDTKECKQIKKERKIASHLKRQIKTVMEVQKLPLSSYGKRD